MNKDLLNGTVGEVMSAREAIALALAPCRPDARGRKGRQWFPAAGALLAGLVLFATPVSATPTTITLATTGTLTVDRAGTLSQELTEELPSSGFFDVYTGTFTVSETNPPTLPVTQPYDLALTGSIAVGDGNYSYTDFHVATATVSEANALAIEARDLQNSSSGEFFPTFLPKTYYVYSLTGEGSGTITIASQTDLATILPDIGPLAAFFTDGTYEISTTGLTLIATPIPVPEPASMALVAAAAFGVSVLARRRSSADRLPTSPRS
jgi:hypothetical protein